MTKHTIIQIARFAMTGILNTAVDLGTLNVLIYAFGLSGSYRFVIFKSVSFLFAAANSFVLNKFWVFKPAYPSASAMDARKQAGSFLAISVLGLLVNIGISYAAVALGKAAFPGVLETLIANAAALAGTCAVLISNFMGYKFLVFRPSYSSVR